MDSKAEKTLAEAKKIENAQNLTDPKKSTQTEADKVEMQLENADLDRTEDLPF